MGFSMQTPRGKLHALLWHSFVQEEASHLHLYMNYEKPVVHIRKKGKTIRHKQMNWPVDDDLPITLLMIDCKMNITERDHLQNGDIKIRKKADVISLKALYLPTDYGGYFIAYKKFQPVERSRIMLAADDFLVILRDESINYPADIYLRDWKSHTEELLCSLWTHHEKRTTLVIQNQKERINLPIPILHRNDAIGIDLKTIERLSNACDLDLVVYLQ